MEPLDAVTPDDRVVGAVDLDRVADRVLTPEQLADHRRANDGNATVAALLGAGEPGALRERVVACLLIAGGCAYERRGLVGGAVVGERDAVGVDDGRGALDVRRVELVLQRTGVGKRELRRAGGRSSAQASERRGGGHQQHVGAERVDLLLDRVRGAGTDRDQHDYRPDADHQPQDRQPGAQLVGGQARERHGDRLVSRFPVGSSARMIAGFVTSARATATRCCWPPESSVGV